MRDLNRKDISSNFEEDQVTLLFNGDSVFDPNSGVTSLYIVCTIAEIIIKLMLNRNFNKNETVLVVESSKRNMTTRKEK